MILVATFIVIMFRAIISAAAKYINLLEQNTVHTVQYTEIFPASVNLLALE